ncbi:MAG: hypothetical protein B6241_03300 [Spirochaetaceae bacterium 4572_59]|nr:MAG: hypothetical protein B6241_03300 [Spirochaetaceae bacterium 4572_59]
MLLKDSRLMNNCFKILLKFLTSLKLTIIILSLIIVLTIPATIIMQNQLPQFYLTNYSVRISCI